DRYEVLRSKPSSLADQQRFGADVLDKIHNVASKFFRLIIIDSGNDETDPLWQAMIAQTDQLVVPTSTADDKTEGAALLLEDLAESSPHGEHLADNAVVVVSQAEQLTKSTYRHRVAQRFEPIAREVVEVPFDPAMDSCRSSCRPMTITPPLIQERPALRETLLFSCARSSRYRNVRTHRVTCIVDRSSSPDINHVFG